MTCLFKLQEQLENTLLLKDVGIACRNSNHLNLDVVSEAAGKETFRCLFGFYQKTSGKDVKYDPASTEAHFGITLDEFRFLFGPSSSSTISERLMMIDAHIDQLEKAIAVKRTDAEAA